MGWIAQSQPPLVGKCAPTEKPTLLATTVRLVIMPTSVIIMMTI